MIPLALDQFPSSPFIQGVLHQLAQGEPGFGSGAGTGLVADMRFEPAGLTPSVKANSFVSAWRSAVVRAEA